MEDVKGAKSFIKYFTYGRLVKWYSRKESEEYPPAYTNIDMDIINEGGVVEKNPFVKVASQPDLWEYKGEIPVLIRCVSGLKLIFRNLTQEIYGDYEGTCPVEYAIKVDDRIIDEDGNEYKVVSVRKSASLVFKHLELKLLP